MSTPSPMVIRGSTALVTGGSAGIGLHVARRLASSGANLVIAARHADTLEKAADSIRGLGVRVLPVPADVACRDDLERLVNRALEEFGGVDILVNNAGVEAFCPYEKLPLERIVQTVQVNLTGALLLTRLVVPGMLERRHGHIVNMASTAGKHGPAFGAAYGATKAALINFTQAIRAEFQDRGVSASAICPGFTDDGGIYDRMKERSGRRSPRLVGSTTVDRVADAVVRAIEKDAAEIIVNWPPMRPLTVLRELFPTLGGRIARAISIRFLKRVAETREPT